MRIQSRLTWVPALVCASATLLAAGPGAGGRAGARPAGAHPPVSTKAAPSAASASAGRPTSVLGAAWSADNKPIRNARLQLRNVITGRIDATTMADPEGQFAFEDVRPGSYVVELVGDGGHVRTVGQVFTINPGETVATFVRVETKAPWFKGFFTSAAEAVALAAASEGVTAIAPVVREASPSSPPANAGGGS